MTLGGKETVNNPVSNDAAERASGSLERMVGPCVDVEQRIKDLYIVNTVVGWAQNQLRILGDMAADHNLPDWYVSEVRRIQSKIETVAQRDDARRPNAALSQAATTRKDEHAK